MRAIPHRLPLPAMIIACVALVVALGGVSYAAGVLPKNSVGSAQLKKKAVTNAKLKKNAVTTAKVKNGSLLTADFKAGQLPAGPQGPKGDPGAQGPAGPAGSPGDDPLISFFHKMSGGQKVTLLQHGTITIEAECLDNQTVQGVVNRDAVRMLVSTSQDGAIVTANNGDAHQGAGGNFLDVATPVDDRELYVWKLANGTAQASDVIDTLSVVDPNGKAITSFGGEGFVAGVNLLGSDCYIGGTFLPIS